MLACAFLFAGTAQASADTYLVDTGSDNGALNACTGAAADCSLRGALGLVNGGSGGDVVNFNPGLTITISSPLPAVSKSATIEATSNDVSIRGNGTYAGSCTASDYGLDVSAAAVSVRGIAASSLCGRAINGNIGAPTITVGPRRADGTLPITGASVDGVVEVFTSDPPASGAEGFARVLAVGAGGGGYYFVPTPEPSSGDRFTAKTYTAGGSSSFSAPVAVAADITSPKLINAVAVNNNTVRLDFDETLAGGSPAPSSFTLTMAGLARGLVTSGTAGNSLYLASNFPWGTGEAGSVVVSGAGAIADASGNQLVGTPSQFVASGPGEQAAPSISRYKVSPRSLCVRYSSRCKRKEIAAKFSLSKASRVTFEVYRGKKFIVKFIRNLEAGSNKVRIFASMNGRKLPLSKKLLLRATPQDLARTPGPQVQSRFRGVKTRKDY